MGNPPPKKHFGQHFLKEPAIARRIAESLKGYGKEYEQVLEIGPGHGVLTQFLYPLYLTGLHLVEIDEDLVPGLKQKFPQIAERIYLKNFLHLELGEIFKEPFAVIGNFPYNISSQILFKIVEFRQMIPEMVGMFQREVAQRVHAGPGNKIYGLLSVWVQIYYQTEYLFTVSEGCFNPPPKVKSAVIRLHRRELPQDMPDERLLLQVVRAAFGQRRKTLRNALKPFSEYFPVLDPAWLEMRAEQLSPEEFVQMGRLIQAKKSDAEKN